MTDYCDLDGTNMTSSDGEADGGGKMDTTPNTALLSMILMFGTFGIGYYLRIFRNSHYFGRTVSSACAFSQFCSYCPPHNYFGIAPGPSCSG